MPPANLGSWLGSTVSTAVKPLYDCFIEHATYLFTTGRNVRDLDTNTRTFVGPRDDVQQQLETGRRNGLVETNEARTWLERANKAVTDEEENRERYEKRCKIFGCWAPNCWSNYKISKKAAKTLVEVNWCSEHRPTTITEEPPPQPVKIVQVMSVSLKASQVSILNQALGCIKDDATVGLVGIWGPRQVGKTLLLKMINNSFGVVDRQESSFHFVIYVTASINCTVKNVQSEILRRLKMQVQDGDSETTRATKISDFLQDKSFLVLLDGLQDDVDLSAVGLPHPLGVVDGQLKRKVVLTTRARNLCHKMNVNRDIYVSGLEMEEALELFNDSAGGEILYSDPNIKEHIENLVDILRAVPAELINFGRDMRGNVDPIQWHDVVHVVKELIKIQDQEAISMRERIVIKLKEDVKKLHEKSSDVRDKIELAKGNGMVATDKAKTWLSIADSIVSDGMAICESERTEANWDISIAAAKLRELRKCLNDRPSDIVQPPSVMHIPVHDVLQPSQVRFVKRARQHIIDDPVGLTAIRGPVGAGKTLLLSMINNSFETGNSLIASSSTRGDPPFDFVIYLTASEECSVQNIQSQIMHRLKMQDDSDSLTTRATRLYKFLQDKSFLVLLDGLKDNLNLAAVGLPPLGIQGQLRRKVVITTRSPSLCDQMRAGRAMNVSGLDMHEALQLFQETVGNDNLYSEPHIGALAKHLVEQLSALPSELIRIGSAMRGKGEPRQWQNVIGIAKELINRMDQESSSLTEGIITKLKQCLRNLRGRSNDVIHKIELGKRKGMVATNEINNWLVCVDTNISVSMVICESEQNELNWDLSVIAADMLRRLQECLDDQPSVVTMEELPPSVLEMPCSSTEQQPSRVKTFEEAMEYIKDNPVGVIGIWGPGGVGKTLLLTKINNSFLEDSLFNYVIFVTAPKLKEGSVEKIQGDITKRLKLQKDDNVKSQANTIFNFLKTVSFLILLDDVWNQIDLEAVGIPYPLGCVAQHRRRKVVLTTRSKRVCGLMDVRKEIRVSCLSDDEAWQLFQEKVGEGTLSSSHHIEVLAKELVLELKGLPLALITVGRAMYNKSNPTQWESAIHYMKQSCCGEDDQDLYMENIVFRRLMFSYESLRNDTLRECLLTCSLWPEDKKILTGDLIRCWIGLGIIAECDMHDSYRKAHSLIGELTAACLLDTCKTGFSDGGYIFYRREFTHRIMPIEACVKMHDVIRDMAIWISHGSSDNKDKWVVRAGVGANLSIQTIPWSIAECISLMSNKINKLPPVRMITCSTKLKKLYLQDNILDGRIFGAIQSFTELTYLDLRENIIEEIPEELCALVNLEHLDLAGNKWLWKVPIRLRELTKLKFLYLGGTRIQRIPKEVISCLTELQVLDLITINWTSPIIIQELCTLKNLKAVDIVIEGDDRYESLRKAAGIPIRDLIISRLEETNELCLAVDTLTGDIAGRTLNELHVERCAMEKLIVGDELGKPYDALSVLALRHLDNLTNIIMWKGTSSQALFPRLTHLDVYSCSKLQHLSWALYLPCLEFLRVRICHAMKQICMGAANHDVNRYRGQESSKTFPCLKYLILYVNYQLSSLCDSDVTFPCLKELDVRLCPKLKRLPITMQKFTTQVDRTRDRK